MTKEAQLIALGLKWGGLRKLNEPEATIIMAIPSRACQVKLQENEWW